MIIKARIFFLIILIPASLTSTVVIFPFLINLLAATEMVPVPPPISIKTTPNSFSSWVSTDLEDAIGCKIISLASIPAASTHFKILNYSNQERINLRKCILGLL